jgi:regulator of sigma E protease
MATFVGLILLILLHELGHFFAAKKFGVRVDEFGIGIPPKAMTITRKGDTEYTLNWLPLGGFVRLFGEDNDLTLFEKLNPFLKKQSFISKPAWQRALILLAGVTMNLVVGILIFSFVYTVTGVPSVERNVAVIAGVAKDSPAELAGMKEGQVVIAVDGVDIKTADDFVTDVGNRKGQLTTFRLSTLLPDQTVSQTSDEVTAIPRENPPAGQGSLGVSVTTLPIVRYEHKPWYVAPFYGAANGLKESYAWGSAIIHSLPKLFGTFVHFRLPEGTTGPVGVVKEGNRVYSEGGLLSLLRFVAVLSINLAIFNLLPFPGLDGGRLLFLGMEKVLGRKRVNKYENYIHSAGILLLIALMIAVTWKDIWG